MMINNIFYTRIKFQEDHVQKRKTGWVLTFLAILLMGLLLYHEIGRTFADPPRVTTIRLIQDDETEVKIHMNVTFPHEKCDNLDAFNVVHQSVFMMPQKGHADGIQLEERKDEKGLSYCSAEGVIVVPRSNGMIWIQSKLTNSEKLKESRQYNFTHTVKTFSLHRMDWNLKDEQYSMHSWMSLFSFDLFGRKGHQNLNLGINGWSFTFPEISQEMLDQSVPTKEEIEAGIPDEVDKLMDQYMYEIAFSPKTVVDKNDELVFQGYTLTFLPHHSRYYLSDSRGWLQDPDESQSLEEDFDRMADPSRTSVVFMYQLYDLSTIVEPDITQLNTFIGRVLAMLGGIFVLFLLADRIINCVPSLCGAKID